MKQLFGRILAGLTAAAASASLAAFSASAATERTLVGYLGDVNADLTVNAEDVYLLAGHLRTGSEITADNAAYADLSGDQIINAVDLTLLKRILLK